MMGGVHSLAVMRLALAVVDDLVLRRSKQRDCTRWLVLVLVLVELHLAVDNGPVEYRSQNCSYLVVGSLLKDFHMWTSLPGPVGAVVDTGTILAVDQLDVSLRGFEIVEEGMLWGMVDVAVVGSEVDKGMELRHWAVHHLKGCQIFSLARTTPLPGV